MLALQRAIARVELAVISVALLVMLICICSNVVDRVFNSPLPDLTEFAVVAMAFLGFLGSSYATYAREHITLDLLDLLREDRRRIIGRVIDAVILLFGAIMSVIAWQFFAYTLTTHEKLLHFGTPVAIPVGTMLVGCVLMTFHALCNLLQRKPAVAAAPVFDADPTVGEL